MRPIDIVTACSWFRTIFVGVKSIGTSLELNGVIVKFLHETIVEQLDMKVKKMHGFFICKQNVCCDK